MYLGPLSVTYVLLGLARLFFFFLYVRACMILKIKAGRLCSLMLGNHRNLGVCCGMMQCPGSLGNQVNVGVRTRVLDTVSEHSALEWCTQPSTKLFFFLF